MPSTGAYEPLDDSKDEIRILYIDDWTDGVPHGYAMSSSA